MTNQDLNVIKNLLQYMSNKCLIGSKEFNEARKHFGITTTYQDKLGENYFVDVFHSNGDLSRHCFDNENDATAFALEQQKK